MKRRLIILLILTGVLPFVLSLPRIYVLIQQNKTWSDAQTYCRDRYIDLAVINTYGEKNNLQTEAQKHQFSSRAWIGLYTNVLSWHWSINNESLGSFTAWRYGEPNNWLRDEFCVFVSWFEWYDAPCIWPMTFVCFDDRETATSSYVFINEYKTWSDAQIYCRQYHTDLANVRDATENSVVGGKLYWGWVWIGLTRDSWKWTDQTTDVSVITWQSRYTADFLYNNSCVYLYGGAAGEEQCLKQLPFFCFAYPRKQQIIRMKFKSSQDVNDPAITASIEEKLKQKLEEHGMRNITVTWRKQPDGEVFHKEENITKDITYAGEDCDSS